MPETPTCQENPLPPKRVGRRYFVGLLGASAVGAVVLRQPDQLKNWLGQLQGFCGSFELEEKSFPPVAPSAYSAFLGAAGLQHIGVQKIMATHFKMRGVVQNSLPPEHLWRNILPTLKVADRIAGELGEKIQIYSAFRSKQYNAACPGASKSSQHLQNRALDIAFRSAPQAVAAVARELRSAGLFRGGVGLYPNFVHIDTRGSNADW